MVVIVIDVYFNLYQVCCCLLIQFEDLLGDFIECVYVVGIYELSVLVVYFNCIGLSCLYNVGVWIEVNYQEEIVCLVV